VLFVSSLAKTDGSKAIRGGIPLVFPQFGQPNKDMPSHGFLRCNYWSVGQMYDNEDEAGCEFTLALNDAESARGEGIWSDGSVDCSLSLKVKVKNTSLTTTLTIKNTGGTEFDYQTLLHSYYKINGSKALDETSCNVVGLDGYNCDDKITNEKSIQDGSPIAIDREVDRIYTPPSGKENLDVLICTGDDGSKISLKATATDGDKDIPVSVVVWNPFIEKAKRLGDFKDEEYHDMLCVEPGILSGMEALASGKSVTFEQIITSV
jgi:glucose-6-phosphate 1-epimerase